MQFAICCFPRCSRTRFAGARSCRSTGKSRKRVTGLSQKVGKQVIATPLGHVTEKWKKHVVKGQEIVANQYEAAAFAQLSARLRSGDVAVGGSRRHQPFEDYLLPKAHYSQLVEKQQTRLAITNTAKIYLEQKQQEIEEKLSRLQKRMFSIYYDT